MTTRMARTNRPQGSDPEQAAATAARDCSASRRILRALFDAALRAADPAIVLKTTAHLPAPVVGRTVVVGAGKASAAMARAFEEAWSGSLEGLVVTRRGHAVPCQRIAIVEASHPVPDRTGEEAARRILDIARG